MTDPQNQPRFLNRMNVREMGLWSAWLLDYPCMVINHSTLRYKEKFISVATKSLVQMIRPEQFVEETWGTIQIDQSRCGMHSLESVAEGYATREPPESLSGIIMQEWAPCMHYILWKVIGEGINDWNDSELRSLDVIEQTHERLPQLWNYSHPYKGTYPAFEDYRRVADRIPATCGGEGGLIGMPIEKEVVESVLDDLPFFGPRLRSLL